jgi:phosphoribosylglycinamide formyltransferase-1
VLKVVVLISGGGSNLKALLDAAADPAYPARVVAVLSDTDAAGLQHAHDEHIPTHVIRPGSFDTRGAWGEALAAAIRSHVAHHTSTADNESTAHNERFLVVSAGLMRVLPPDFVKEFSPNLINTHPALLPLYPGAHAVRDALAAGATETGVTVHIIDEGVDTGPVLRQRSVPIHAGEDEADLHERIKLVERPLLVESVRDIATGTLTLTPTP